MRKRWNVAVSRARDQVWAVYSFDPATQLQEGDIRKTFFDYLSSAKGAKARPEPAEDATPLAADVAQALESRGCLVRRCYRAGTFTLPLVVETTDGRVAIECDGELPHPDPDRVVQEMERQTVLERAGWRFLHVRGGKWQRDPRHGIECLVESLGLTAVPGSPTATVAARAQMPETEASSGASRTPGHANESQAGISPSALKAMKASGQDGASASPALVEKPAVRDRALSAARRAKREKILAELMRLGAQVSSEVKKGARG